MRFMRNIKNMKNKDLYKEKLASLTDAPALVNGELVDCGDSDCNDCWFFRNEKDCFDVYNEWLNTEVNTKEIDKTVEDKPENKRYVLTEGYIMQLSLKDFNIEVSLPMARAIKDRFLELMVQHGHMRKEEN